MDEVAAGTERGYSGFLDGLRWQVDEQKLRPNLCLGDSEVPLDEFIGASLRLEATGRIACTHCGRATRRSFSQGYCYPCFKKLARCDLCIMSPTRCHRAAGTCREPEWADQFCFSAHSVYLANSSGLKVGLTRAGNERRRWADQGAVQGIVLAHCETRIQAGALEARVAERHSDRTNWRKLVAGAAEPLDLETLRIEIRSELLAESPMLPDGVRWADTAMQQLEYPVAEYGLVKSRNLDKEPVIEGRLLGIKGQYLLLDSGAVNLRRHGAYELNVTLRSPTPSPTPEPHRPPAGPTQTEIFGDP